MLAALLAEKRLNLRAFSLTQTAAPLSSEKDT